MANSARRPVAEKTAELSVVVKLIDAVTGDQPKQEWPSRFALASSSHEEDLLDQPYPRVILDGTTERPIENPSGYLLFLDVSEESIKTISVKGGSQYVDQSDVALPNSDPNEPLEVVLLPSSSYPLPPKTSFIYGHLLDDDNEPISNASIRIQNVGRSTKTSTDGTFFLSVTGDTVVHQEKEGNLREKVLQIKKNPPTLEVQYEDISRKRTTVTLPERSAVRYSLSIVASEEPSKPSELKAERIETL
jgi:hypothetical protein